MRRTTRPARLSRRVDMAQHLLGPLARLPDVDPGRLQRLALAAALLRAPPRPAARQAGAAPAQAHLRALRDGRNGQLQVGQARCVCIQHTADVFVKPLAPLQAVSQQRGTRAGARELGIQLHPPRARRAGRALPPRCHVTLRRAHLAASLCM